MLSRRLLRIKVFQAVYNNLNNPAHNYSSKENKLTKLISDFKQAYHLSILYLVKIAQFSEKKLEIISNKYIVKDEDKIFNTRLLNNPIIADILSNDTFDTYVTQYHLDKKIDSDTIQKLFNALSKKDKFVDYSTSESLTFSVQRKIVAYLFNKILLKSDLFKSEMEDEFLNWNEDKLLIYKGLSEKFRKINESDFPVYPYLYQPLKKESKDFAYELLQNYHLHHEEIFEIIKPKLKNWDAERITVVDKILLTLAVSELIYFENIPTKVTINEYIEISKSYSTLNSKDFINGVLDKIKEELKLQGKINKKGRGLIEF